MAKEPTAKERIDYLVGRRFPLSYLLKIPPSISLSSRGPPPDTRELRIAVEAFTKELAALAPEALVARWNEENRSSVPQEIADDLAKHSIFLDVDTVRKWLKQAAEFMPGE